MLQLSQKTLLSPALLCDALAQRDFQRPRRERKLLQVHHQDAAQIQTLPVRLSLCAAAGQLYPQEELATHREM